MKKNTWQEIEVLVREAKAGDKLALEKLMKNFEFYIYKSALSIYVAGYDHDDLMQIGYMTVMKAVDKYDITKSNFIKYVTFAISNNFRCLIRDRAKENAYTSLDVELVEGFTLGNIIADEEINIERDYIKEELGIEMREAVEGLPFKLQEVIKYVYIEEYGTLKEFSRATGINYNTVVKRKNLAFTKLQKVLKARGRML